jgi:uncharacterized membrane protein SpoIIM required for sporulation
MLLKYLYLFVLSATYFIGVFVGVQNALLLKGDCITSEENNLEIDMIYSQEPFQRFLSIASNNALISLKNILFGIFSLGIFPIACTFYNGAIFGSVLGNCIKFLPLNIILKSTLPHCAEIVGVIMSGYIGFIISIRLIFKIKVYDNKRIVILTLITFAIILISALIESYVSMS